MRMPGDLSTVPGFTSLSPLTDRREDVNDVALWVSENYNRSHLLDSSMIMNLDLKARNPDSIPGISKIYLNYHICKKITVQLALTSFTIDHSPVVFYYT